MPPLAVQRYSNGQRSPFIVTILARDLQLLQNGLCHGSFPENLRNYSESLFFETSGRLTHESCKFYKRSQTEIHIKNSATIFIAKFFHLTRQNQFLKLEKDSFTLFCHTLFWRSIISLYHELNNRANFTQLEQYRSDYDIRLQQTQEQFVRPRQKI